MEKTKIELAELERHFLEKIAEANRRLTSRCKCQIIFAPNQKSCFTCGSVDSIEDNIDVSQLRPQQRIIDDVGSASTRENLSVESAPWLRGPTLDRFIKVTA